MGEWRNTLIEAEGGGGKSQGFQEGKPGKGITFEMQIKKISNKKGEMFNTIFIRERQIKKSLTFHIIPIIMTKIKNSSDNTC